MTVILINPFEVEPGREDECLAYWEQAPDFMAAQPGYISTRLHRSIDGRARFTFINIAEWESPEHFFAAVGSEEFRALAAPGMEAFPHFPGLYTVVRSDARGEG